MAGESLPVTGEAVKITILVNGAVIKDLDVESCSEKAEEEVVETMPLGTHDVRVKRVPKGWSGRIVFIDVNTALDDVWDAIEAAQRAGLGTSVAMMVSRTYFGVQQRRYLYNEIVFSGYDRDNQRGQATKPTVNWRSGKARTAA